MKKIFLVLVIVLVAAVGWHMKIARDLEARVDEVTAEFSRGDWELESSVNPFSSVITIHVQVKTEELDDWAGLKAGVLKTMADEVASSMIEEELARTARERRDVYAMVVPYRIRTTVGY